MRVVADMHVHSRWSRATGRAMTLWGMARWAAIKGVDVISTGDFTHPRWLAELEELLEERRPGLYSIRAERSEPPDGHPELPSLPSSCRREVLFVLSTEISLIYKSGGRTRKVHLLVFMPDLGAARRFAESLGRLGNVTSDGRPILGIDVRKVMELVVRVDERGFVVPAHIWTPHFSVLGAASGFSSLEECFGEYSSLITAVETGLSSDPPMNRLLSSLDGVFLVSNSDAHSPEKIAREATLFDVDELSYDALVAAMRTGKGLAGTIEFFPQEGKYHFDGHRKCGLRLYPTETAGYGGRCPLCGGKLTVGVLHRVLDLADRDEPGEPEVARPYHHLIPLKECLAELLGVGPATMRVARLYRSLIEEFGPELRILLEVSPDELERKAPHPLIGEMIRRLRRGDVEVREGYDGEYGRIFLFREGEMERLCGQRRLFLE